MRRKRAYGRDYRKPWIRRSQLHQRTQLSDHADQVIFLVLVIALAAVGLIFLLHHTR